MNKLRVFLYSLKQGTIGLLRNWFMILSSVFVMFAMFFILGCLLLMSYNISLMLERQSVHTEISVDCDVSVTDQASMAIELILSNDNRVDTVKRISKAENLAKMLEIFMYDEEKFEQYASDESFMYVSFEINLHNTDDIEQFSEDVKKIAGIDATSVTHNMPIYEFFTSLNFWVRFLSGLTIVVLGVISLLLCVNTIRLTVFTRKKELEIMRILGAPNVYIKGPFVMEGVLIGGLSALFAVWAIKGAYVGITNYLVSTPSAIQAYFFVRPFESFEGNILFGFLLAGVLVGVLAGVTATEKYLEK